MYHLEDFADVCVLFRNYAQTIADKAQARARPPAAGPAIAMAAPWMPAAEADDGGECRWPLRCH